MYNCVDLTRLPNAFLLKIVFVGLGLIYGI